MKNFPADLAFVMTDIEKKTHIFQVGGESFEFPQGVIPVRQSAWGLVANKHDVERIHG